MRRRRGGGSGEAGGRARQQRLVQRPDRQRAHVRDGAVVAVLVQRLRGLERQTHLRQSVVQTTRRRERLLMHTYASYK